MNACFKCKDKPTCKKICAEVEGLLPKMSEGRLPNEFSLTNEVIDNTFAREDDGNITNLWKRRNKGERGV